MLLKIMHVCKVVAISMRLDHIYLNIFKKLEVSVKVICDLICDLPITTTWHITLHLLLSESSRKRPSNKVYDSTVTGYTDRHLNPMHCPTMEPCIYK